MKCHMLAFGICAIALTGCEGSPAWYLSNPDRKIIELDGYEVSVLPRGDNKYDAFYAGLVNMDGAIEHRKRQIKAVELATGCRVTDQQYLPGTAIMQAEVACKNSGLTK